MENSDYKNFRFKAFLLFAFYYIVSHNIFVFLQTYKKSVEMKIIIASDHAGYELKEKLITHFNKEFEWINNGPFSSESVDYPDYAHPLAEAVARGEYEFGILICGTGNGIGMTANKHVNVRAALCWIPEIAALARQHNNANILVMPARFISDDLAFEIVKTFFSTEFEGGRHLRRVQKINIQ